MPTVNAAIIYLTQNTDVRRTYLKTSLYFLFRNFNDKFRYPVLIFHEGDYDYKSQQDILLSIRESCRSLVSFVALPAHHFGKLPDNIDADKLNRILAVRPVPYWRNKQYRLMCRWWMVYMPTVTSGYDYIMRMDDDSIIEEPVQTDLFKMASDKGLVYMSNMIHVDCGVCCYGMKDFFMKLCPDKKAILDQAFVPQTIDLRRVEYHGVRAMISLTASPLPNELPREYTLQMPTMYYNNFHITRPDFWVRPDVAEAIKHIDDHKGIFYHRWGDAPLQSLLVLLYAKPEQVSRCVFKYSKRMQREAFIGDDGQHYCYMPQSYDKSSCITEK